MYDSQILTLLHSLSKVKGGEWLREGGREHGLCGRDHEKFKEERRIEKLHLYKRFFMNNSKTVRIIENIIDK